MSRSASVMVSSHFVKQAIVMKAVLRSKKRHQFRQLPPLRSSVERRFKNVQNDLITSTCSVAMPVNGPDAHDSRVLYSGGKIFQLSEW
jgi:hypothetical protein